MPDKSRKLPTQARSIATVEALLEATTRILLQDGVKSLTTNRVAEIAGVSIGSLYQYFPNKASLIAALIDHHVEHEVAVLSKAFNDWDGSLGEPLVRAAIAEFIQIHLDDLELTKLLHEQVSYLECRHALRQATKHFEALIAEVLRENFQHQLADKVIRIKAFVATNAIDSLIQLALAENTELLSEPEFVDELVKLVLQTFTHNQLIEVPLKQ